MAIDTSPAKAARKFICPHCNASYDVICTTGLILDSADQGICRDINAVVLIPGKEKGVDMVDTNEKPFRCPHCESAFGRFVYFARRAADSDQV